jgi:hypothetical protein
MVVGKVIETSPIAQVVSRTGHYRYFVIGSYALWSVAEGIQTTLDKQSSVAKVAGIMLFTGFACAGTFQTYVCPPTHFPRSDVDGPRCPCQLDPCRPGGRAAG